VVQPSVLAFGGHPVQRLAAFVASAFLVSEDIAKQDSAVAAAQEVRGLAVGEQLHSHLPRQPGGTVVARTFTGDARSGGL